MKEILIKETVLGRLELTQSSFHTLVHLLDEETAKQKSIVTKRSLKAVIAHLVISTEIAYPMFIANARKNKAMPRFFGTALGHWFSFKLSERRANRESLESLLDAYDVAHLKLGELIEQIDGDEWQLTSVIPKPRNERLTLEDFFCIHTTRHFEIHREEVEKTLQALHKVSVK